MAMIDDDQRTAKWVWRAAAVIAGPPFIFWMANNFGVVALFPLVGWAIILVWLFDLPQLLFSAFDAARHKVAGVESKERHEWYGFRGTRMRLFLDDRGAPWIAVKELAHVLEIADVDDAFSLYRPTEYASPRFANGEACLSDTGLRRLLKYSRHRDAHAVKLWWEREVLLPLHRRRELFSAKSGKRVGERTPHG
jgi:hypothetical protein